MAYSPASVTTGTSSLGHLQQVHYDQVAVENLKAHLPFMEATTRRILPQRTGKTIQLFGYQTLGPNTTPGTEGTVGTGIAPTTVSTQISLNQYFDFMSFSDYLVETALDNIVENSAAEMGYRAALTTNALTVSAFEAAVSTNVIDLSDNEFFTAAIARQALWSLKGQNVSIGPNGSSNMMALIHPLNVFDLVNDNTAGGLLDMLKYTDAGAAQLQRGVATPRSFSWGGVDYVETTTVPTYANYPSTGKTGFATYVIGKDAVFSVSLGSTQVPNEKNFNLLVRTYDGVDRTDAAGVIRATIGYNFKYAVGARPSNSVPTFRRIRSESSIS